jgi:hypothetical protein
MIMANLLRFLRKPDWQIDSEQLRRRMADALIDEGGHVYMCIENFLPTDLYKTCVAYWPDRRHFDNPDAARARLTLGQLPTAAMPQDIRSFWLTFGEWINGPVKQALVDVFRPYLARKLDWLPADELDAIDRNLAFFDHHNEGLNLDRQYNIGPHVDQKFIFVSSLLYMPQNRRQQDMGTWLYRPKSPDLRTVDIEFVDPGLLEPYKPFPFLPNTLVSFLQTPTAFHGRPGIQSRKDRRTYQFNVIMTHELTKRIYGDPTLY